MQKKTSKKVKVVGTEQFVNTKTGEVEDFQVVSIEERDFNFHKIWMSHIISSLDLIGNKKVKLAFWIIDHLNKENQLTMTYRQIAEKSDISLETVRVTMTALIESNFLIRVNQGVYQVNPDVVFKGTRNSRLNVLYQYNQTKSEQEPPKAKNSEKQLDQALFNDTEQEQIDGQMTIADFPPVAKKEVVEA